MAAGLDDPGSAAELQQRPAGTRSSPGLGCCGSVCVPQNALSDHFLNVATSHSPVYQQAWSRVFPDVTPRLRFFLSHATSQAGQGIGSHPPAEPGRIQGCQLQRPATCTRPTSTCSRTRRWTWQAGYAKSNGHVPPRAGSFLGLRGRRRPGVLRLRAEKRQRLRTGRRPASLCCLQTRRLHGDLAIGLCDQPKLPQHQKSSSSTMGLSGHAAERPNARQPW